MSSLNAVEALLTRLSLSNAIPSFRAAGVEKIISLRNLSEDRLKELLPDPEQRQKLTDALTRNTDAAAKVGPPAIAPGPVLAYNDQQGSSEARSGGPQKVCRYFRTSQGCKKGAACNLPHIDGPPLPTDSAPTAPRQRRACRDFFEGGCKYGAECRYSHSDDANREPAAGEYVNNDTYSEEVQVPFESVRYLLGNKAEKLQRIHTMCGTSNTRIEKPESYMSHYYIRVKGSKEGVQMARAEIERLVGITSAQNTEARFQYVSHELERNVQSCKMLAAFNLASKGTALEITEATLKSLVSTFRFQVPAKIDHYWMLTGLGDKEKLEVCSRCIKHMPAVQAIIFVDHKRAVEMEKRASMTSQAFGLPAVQFVHRDQAKDVRLASLESFKNGSVRDGFKNRLLVTTSDYAKLARKVIIPYVNMVIHFSIPKTKEIYTFQSLCCGRRGTKGVNLMFILNSDASTQREWSESLPLKEMNEIDWEKSVQDLQYDTEAKTLTPIDAEPAANWREQLEAEKAAKPPKPPAATPAAAATPATAPAAPVPK